MAEQHLQSRRFHSLLCIFNPLFIRILPFFATFVPFFKFFKNGSYTNR